MGKGNAHRVPPREKIATFGPTFDPTHKPIYLINSPITDCSPEIADIRLPGICVSAHEMSARRPMPAFEAWWARGDITEPRAFALDLGCRYLAGPRAEELGRPYWEARLIPLDDIPGGEKHWRHVLAVLERYRDRLWGVFELDQGDVEERARLRARLEAEAGVRAIPIYQISDDPWDYFDELVRTHDRVSVNVIGRYGRESRLLATLFERWQRADPSTWVHLLGYTPTHYLHAYPFPSTDSSDWTAAVKWDGLHPRLDARRFGAMPRAYRHQRGAANDGPRGTRKVARLAAINALFDERVWAEHHQSFARLAEGG